MKRSIAITSALVLALSSLLFVAEASARAGGGSSGGSRGSRSYSAPAPGRPVRFHPAGRPPPQVPWRPPMQSPQRSGWGGMLGGLLVGGLIGSLLFGGMGGGLGGLGGGIGLMEIVLIGGLIVFAIIWMRRRQAAGAAGTPAYAGGYGAGLARAVGSPRAGRRTPAADRRRLRSPCWRHRPS